MDDLVKSARSTLTRAELPGMSRIEHLEELRKTRYPHLVVLKGTSAPGSSLLFSLTLDSTVAMKGDFGPSIQHNGRIEKHDCCLVKDRLRWCESP